MPIIIERKDYEFLLRSEIFCHQVDHYAALLELEDERLEAYKTNNKMLAHVFNNPVSYSSCLESFTRIKIQQLRADYLYLEQKCRSSRGYTLNIGIALGIETGLWAFSIN